MTQDQYDKIMNIVDEAILGEVAKGLQPRFQELKQELESSNVESLDWFTVMTALSVLHVEFLADYDAI